MRHQLPPDIPAEAVPFLQDMGYLEPDRLGCGDAAPDATVSTPDGEAVRLARYFGGQPVVLIFGSYT